MVYIQIPKLKRERIVVLTGREAVSISVLSLAVAFIVFSGFLMYEGADPIEAYRNIFSFAFDQKLGLSTTLHRGFFILFATLAFIIPMRAGLWNVGMEGQFYLGTIGAFAVAYTLPTLHPGILIPLMLLAGALFGAFYGALAGFLRGKLNVNEVVTTLMLNNIAFWLVYLLTVGGPWAGIAESTSRPLPASAHAPIILNTPFTSFLVIGIAVILYIFLKYSSIGYQIRVLGNSPAAAKHIGISAPKITVLVMALGGAIAGLSGYHMWAGDPAFFMIPRPEAYKAIADLTYWGLIIGLICLLNSIAAIPLSVFIGSILVGSTVLVRRLRLPFGLDVLFLGIISLTFVAFQFFHYYRIKIKRRE
ncbi:MAG: ABC transporter permease [Aigarchaeota archaeon]|nr:ABC transporter permease [Aigarchaeota archaeon]MCX8192872.1 ABC transporter permease [Nitrososphaeria archaeon]MDW7986600.1 ABC transporter permease [Nitrososphaerota archaeon]